MVKVEGVNQFGKLLGPAAIKDLRDFFQRQKGDKFRWYVDWPLADIVLEHCKGKERKLIHESMVDKRITKQFLNRNETMEQLEHFSLPQRPNFSWNENYAKAVQLCREIYGIKPKSLRPLALEKDEIGKVFSNLNASAGVVAISKEKHEVIDDILKLCERLKREISAGAKKDLWLPAVPFHRAQISKYYDAERECLTTKDMEYKDRVVWCIDAATVGIESQYARPAIDRIAGSCMCYAGGLDNHAISKFLHNHCMPKNWLSIDYSKFDQTIPSWLIHSCFSIITEWFPDYCMKELNWIEDRFIHTYVLRYDGTLFQKHHGIPSGSHFTQLVGSMCNLIMVLTFLFSKYKTEEKVRFQLASSHLVRDRRYFTVITMGDDNLLFTFDKIDINELSSYVFRNFGVKVNAGKSDVGGARDVPTFLKRRWYNDGEARNFVEFWINSIHPERDRKYDGYSPWHIIYGIYLTYEHTMRHYFLESEIIEQMSNSTGGIVALRSLDPLDLPGALRAIRDSDPDFLYRRAKTFLSSRDAA